ncbi:MAG: hypothetical protein WA667_07255 [Candidatus Nitrosopolaris sp.]
MVYKIIWLAEIFNIAVVITNQVSSSPDTLFGDLQDWWKHIRIIFNLELQKRWTRHIIRIHRRFTLNEKRTDDIQE